MTTQAFAPTMAPRVPFAESRWYALMTVLILAIGGCVIPFFGWVVGVVFLWMSRGWSVPIKVLGTLALPGGALFLFALAFAPALTSQQISSCEIVHGDKTNCIVQNSGTPPWIGLSIVIALVLVQVASSIVVYRRFRLARP